MLAEAAPLAGLLQGTRAHSLATAVLGVMYVDYICTFVVLRCSALHHA